MKWFKRLREWFSEPALVPLEKPPVEHRIASERIVAGWVFVINTSNLKIVLEGSIIKQLVIDPMGVTRVKSPVLEAVWRLGDMVTKPDGNVEAQREIAYINEWDALEVVENMIDEYARARAYDMMTPDELKKCTLPFPKRALGDILVRIGLKAQRENENVSA